MMPPQAGPRQSMSTMSNAVSVDANASAKAMIEASGISS